MQKVANSGAKAPGDPLSLNKGAGTRVGGRAGANQEAGKQIMGGAAKSKTIFPSQTEIEAF
jgi:hypothetical protein